MPFFGVPIRNGLPIGLGSVAGFGAPQEFTPAELFIGGTAGTWYDPSDLTTMFTTSAGTTPVAMPGQGSAVSVGRMLDKSGNGNHAIAINNSTARPELRARVNLLTYSEEFDNAAWTKNSASITKDSAVAPDGTTTADTLIPTAVNDYHSAYQNPSLIGGVGYTRIIYAKAAGYQYLQLDMSGVYSTDCWANFDVQNGATGSKGVSVLSSSIDPVGNGWWKCTVVANTLGSSGSSFHHVAVVPSLTATRLQAFTGDGTSGIYIWGADLRPANIGANVPAYQRIADANTYDVTGFPLYLRFDGIDDGMYTPANLNLTATDKVGVFAGVRKNVLTTGFVAETSAAAESNNGAFRIGVDSGGIEYFISSRGTVSQQVNIDNAAYLPPVSNVVQSSFDIAAPLVSVRLNGVAVGSNTSSQGTGNFGTYPLYIGSRNNASFFFNGHLHGLIVVGSAVSAGNISATESWMAGKTGLSL